eukprot:9038084-Alexandrium_andersonii.AAC.1
MKTLKAWQLRERVSAERSSARASQQGARPAHFGPGWTVTRSHVVGAKVSLRPRTPERRAPRRLSP